MIEIDSDSDREIDLKKKDGTELRSMKSNLQLMRTMNKRRFQEARQMKQDDKEIFTQLCRNIVFIDFEEDTLP